MSLEVVTKIVALRCDLCPARIEVDAERRSEALQQIGASDSYEAGQRWARVPLAHQWEAGFWRPGLFDLCPACFAEQNRRRMALQAGFVRVAPDEIAEVTTRP